MLGRFFQSVITDLDELIASRHNTAKDGPLVTQTNHLSFLVPVQRRNLKEMAYTQLRTGLIRGQFAPGYPLTVRGVADALGTSPMPVRAALERLEAEGALTALDENRTLAVPELSLDAYLELRAIRALLEGAATEAAAASINQDSDLHSIEQACQGMQAAADAGDLEDYLNANWQFHFSVYRLSRMPVLVSMIESLWLRTGAYVRWMLPDGESLSRSMPNHWVLFEALKDRDAVAAKRAITADIMDCSEHLLRVLAEKGKPANVQVAKRVRL